MAIPHTVVTGAIKPAVQGWILFHGMRSHYWHWLKVDWTTPCQSTRIVKPTDIMEWRPEPKGRWEVCPDCRRHLQREEQRVKAAAEVVEQEVCTSCNKPWPEREVINGHCYICRLKDLAQREPEVITASHIPFPTPAASPPTPKVPTVSNGQPAKPPITTNAIEAVGTFAAKHGLSVTQLMVFTKQRLPDLPRYKKAYMLDRAAQAIILAEFPAWVAARNEETRIKASAAVKSAREKRLDNLRAKHAASAIQAKAISTFQSIHTTPAGNVERVMAAIAEVRDLVLMLAEDVAKLQAQAPRINASQDGDA